jgi:hypothetical protein
VVTSPPKCSASVPRLLVNRPPTLPLASSKFDIFSVEFGRWIWFASVRKNGFTSLCLGTMLMNELYARSRLVLF